MKNLVVYVSTSHGNTKKVAEAISETLGADMVEAKDVNLRTIQNYELIGFGSGIFYRKFHGRLLKVINEIPPSKSKAFIFSTSGYGTINFHKSLREVLEAKGFQIIGDFACKGWDTWTPFKLVGGINKGMPDENDLARAREFAKGLGT